MLSVKLNDYQASSASVAASRDLSLVNLANFGLGIFGEFGEVADLIKKVVGQGHDLQAMLPELKKELGDCLWYVSMLALVNGVSLSVLAGCESFDEIYTRRSDKDLFDVAESLLRSTKFVQDVCLTVAYPLSKRDITLYEKDACNQQLRMLLNEIAMIASWLHLSLGEIAQLNIDKLTTRFPNGFTVEASVNRQVAVEDKV